jgi:hypothetical protein
MILQEVQKRKSHLLDFPYSTPCTLAQPALHLVGVKGES